MAYRHIRRLRVLLSGLLLAAAACGGRGDAQPAPPPPPPDLAGVRIMLIPVRAPAPARVDAELAFWLQDRAGATDWVLPDELQRVADRTPAWRLRLDALQRPILDMGGHRRVGDPLYGALRQLGAVVDADYALVPLGVGETADTAGVALSMAVAVVDIRGGRVLWLHTAHGERNSARATAVASVAEAVARSLVPW